MTTLVLDTSVAIAWYLPETFSETARTWQARLLDERVQLIAPTLHYWESIALATHLDVALLTAERRSTPWVKKLGKRIQSVLE